MVAVMSLKTCHFLRSMGWSNLTMPHRENSGVDEKSWVNIKAYLFWWKKMPALPRISDVIHCIWSGYHTLLRADSAGTGSGSVAWQTTRHSQTQRFKPNKHHYFGHFCPWKLPLFGTCWLIFEKNDYVITIEIHWVHPLDIAPSYPSEFAQKPPIAAVGAAEGPHGLSNVLQGEIGIFSGVGIGTPPGDGCYVCVVYVYI